MKLGNTYRLLSLDGDYTMVILWNLSETFHFGHYIRDKMLLTDNFDVVSFYASCDTFVFVQMCRQATIVSLKYYR